VDAAASSTTKGLKEKVQGLVRAGVTAAPGPLCLLGIRVVDESGTMTRKSSEAAVVALDGTLTMRTVEATYAKLLEAAGQAALEIDVSGATEIDLSLVQLILAARATAREAGTTVRLAQPAAGPLLDALQRGGFLSTGAEAATDDQAFWLEPARA
jgi:anti-anti-sigma regulatory factor